MNKKPINADKSDLTEKTETNPKPPNFKINYRLRITKYKNIFSKGYIENWSREIFNINSVLKSNPWAYKLNDLNKGKILRSFHEKKFLLTVILEIKSKQDQNCQTMLLKKLDHATGDDTSDLAAKKEFIALKTEVDKLDTNKLVNVLTSLNNLNTNVDDLDIGKLKTVLVDSTKLSDAVANEVIENTKFNTLKTHKQLRKENC